ncbi:MAG: hypothetical protein IT582_08820 [Opitutaceae bacterium]|nr:hypothetical protein [Opitutaceae bacterium]
MHASVSNRATRATVFACVPDWSLSNCKSSKAILEEFGYARDGQFKLYCTVSTQNIKSQGLTLELDEARRWMQERFARTPARDVAVWRLETLEHSLSTKHRETFWIDVESMRRGNREFFQLKSVIHTRNPNLPQLERMLGDGSVRTISLNELPQGARMKGGLCSRSPDHESENCSWVNPPPTNFGDILGRASSSSLRVDHEARETTA